MSDIEEVEKADFEKAVIDTGSFYEQKCCKIFNTVNTLYSEVLNLHYMVNLDEKWSKIFTIW